MPIVIEAPADRKTRNKWLERLWKAIQDDSVDYRWTVQDQWGKLCSSREVASRWADQLLGLLRTAWSDPRPTTGAPVVIGVVRAMKPTDDEALTEAQRRRRLSR